VLSADEVEDWPDLRSSVADSSRNLAAVPSIPDTQLATAAVPVGLLVDTKDTIEITNKSPQNFETLVLGCKDSHGSETRRIFSFFEIYNVYALLQFSDSKISTKRLFKILRVF
jgi:hypothetical protein